MPEGRERDELALRILVAAAVVVTEGAKGSDPESLSCVRRLLAKRGGPWRRSAWSQNRQMAHLYLLNYNPHFRTVKADVCGTRQPESL
jgi:hypothetical protein